MIKIDTCDNIPNTLKIFDEIKYYYPGFNQWFSKCQALKRTALVVEDFKAITILKIKLNSIKICTFVVDSNFRKNNIGSQLMDNIKNFARSTKSINHLYLSVKNENTVFISFCKKNDFSIINKNNDETIFQFNLN